MENPDLARPEFASASWALEGLRGNAMPAEPRDPLTPDWRRSPAQLWTLLNELGALFAGNFRIAATRGTQVGCQTLLVFDLVSSTGKRTVMRCFLEAKLPYRLRTFGVGRPVPEGYTVREATRADAAALAALEASVPIKSDSAMVSIDRGVHYWDHMKLMGSPVTVAEYAGEIVAVMANAILPLRASGVERSPAYLHHGRTRSDHQGKGISRAMMGRAMEYDMPRVGGDGGSFFLVASNNSQALAPWPEDMRWRVRPRRLLFDVRELAAKPAGRKARAEDASRLIRLINSCHEKEDLFLPYTRERFHNRLGCVPSIYSWEHLRVREDAAIGVGSAIELRRHTPLDGTSTETRRAPILDFGFAGDRGEASFEELLRGACTEVADTDATHLTLFSSPSSPGYSRLRALASEEETYELITLGGIEEPETAARDGVYIDQLYF